MAPVSVLVFDLDHFKAINDRSGHATGDAMLQLFAKVARETLRATDIICRLGGEEFVALLPSAAAEAAIAAERVREKYGFLCSRALGQLARIEARAAQFEATPGASITIVSFEE